MLNNQPPVHVDFTPLFHRFLKHLAKKYSKVRTDVQPLIDQLEQGATPGDQIKGTEYTAYKVRVKNTAISRGKSGGFRVIYYLKTADVVVLLAIYSKTELTDISAAEITRMIKDYE